MKRWSLFQTFGTDSFSCQTFKNSRQQEGHANLRLRMREMIHFHYSHLMIDLQEKTDVENEKRKRNASTEKREPQKAAATTDLLRVHRIVRQQRGSKSSNVDSSLQPLREGNPLAMCYRNEKTFKNRMQSKNPFGS